MIFLEEIMRELNPRPVSMSHTTKPLDQRGISCQKSDFKSLILLYTHVT